MLGKIIVILAILAVGFAAYAATRPDDFTISRVATIDATPERLFPLVNDLHQWNAWSPWAKTDPNATVVFSGAPAGVGAVMNWVSDNNQVGIGEMTITESHPSDHIKIRLDFVKPFQTTNVAEFTFSPQGSKTSVMWTMTGSRDFIAKAMDVVLDCDKMVGDQFDQGLANLQSIAENK